MTGCILAAVPIDWKREFEKAERGRELERQEDISIAPESPGRIAEEGG